MNPLMIIDKLDIGKAMMAPVLIFLGIVWSIFIFKIIFGDKKRQ